MADVTVIGRGANVVGRIVGAVDLAIHGRVEGEVAVEGEVTVETEGLVAASVSGRVVTVRGAVKGDVTAEEGIRLEDGARVLGDLRAPRVAVTRGALVRGFVQTQGIGAGGGRGGQPAAKAARPRPAPAHTSSPRHVVAPPARKAPVPTLLSGSAPSTSHGGKGPPPPVVPVLRKGAKGTLRKKAG
jgi:cytoskeletal protein CcmA (bactofilin family)